MQITFFDLETTGVDTKNDRIVQICLIKKTLFDEETETYTWLVNPGIPIPQGASDVHGITDDMVADAPTFKRIADQILDIIGYDDPICGFNSNAFDVPLLFNEFQRAGITWHWQNHQLIDAGNIFKLREPRTLSAASLFYLGKELKDAHDATNDVRCTIEVLEAQIRKYEINEIDLEEASLFGGKPVDINRYFVYDENEEIIINFGKHRGSKAKDHKSYISWMFNSDFPSDTIEVCRGLLIS